MVAKANTESRLKSPSNDVYEPWVMTERERALTTKCIRFIQGRIPNKEVTLDKISSPAEEPDMTGSMMSSCLSSSSHE